MTASDRSIPSDVLQSFFQLRDSVDAFSCLVDFFPVSEIEHFDPTGLRVLLGMISFQMYGLLDVHFSSLRAEFVKR